MAELKVLRKSGKVLRRGDGSIIRAASPSPACCCEPTGPAECSDLCNAGSQPASISVSFGGITDDGCASCSILNGSFDCPQTSDCTYQKGSIAVGGCTDPFFGGQLYASVTVLLGALGVTVILQVGAIGSLTFFRSLTPPVNCSSGISGAAAWQSGSLGSGCSGGPGSTCTIA